MPWSPPRCWPDCFVWRGKRECARCRTSRRCRPGGLAAAEPSRRCCLCLREMRAQLVVGLVLFLAGSLEAQKPLPDPAIEDNSFLIEEAYNQDPGVVQHISTVTLTGPERRDAVVGFTQEWPLRGLRHQLSYSLLYQIQQGDAPDGFGDLLLNYRQQLHDSDVWAFAPRLSLILPTGSERKGLGAGTVGGQVNLPVSVRIGPALAAHLNAGTQVLARVRDSAAAG